MESPLKPRVRKRSQFLYPEDEGSPERVGDGGGSSSAPAKKKRPRQQLPPGTPPPPRLHAPLSPVQSQTLNGGAIQSLEERIVAGMPAFAKEGGVALLVVNLRLAAEQYGGGEFDTRLRVPKSVILRDDLIAVLGKILDRPDWLTRWAGTVISFAPPPASREKCNHWAAPKPVPDCLPKSEPPNDGCTYHDALGKGHVYGFGAAYAAADHQLMVLARDRVPGIVQKLNPAHDAAHIRRRSCEQSHASAARSADLSTPLHSRVPACGGTQHGARRAPGSSPSRERAHNTGPA